MEMLDRCERCGSTRLSVMLGEVVCRQCGLVAGTLETQEPLVE
jgi:transcription initiation factor TFIIIB Brf1 subunit/transcription initiation factor TFIIB